MIYIAICYDKKGNLREKKLINLDNVTYFYSQNKIVYVRFKNGEEICSYKKLNKVEREVNEICNFFGRVNKNYLVNVSCVTKFIENEIHIGDLILTISPKYKDKLLVKLIDDRLGIL